MENTTKNVPDVIRQQAKEAALKIIADNQGCISCVRPEDLDTQSLFIPVVSVIKPTPEDFYDPIPEVGIMMKPPLTNKIREMAGIEILRTETEKRGEYIWHAHVFGQKRMPDGTMMKDDASYEFDAEKRSEMDILGDKRGKYPTDIDKRLHLLKTAKFGDQRAVTGAQHALIHKLAKIPRSFRTPQELMRGMIVCRVDRNVNGLLQDPEMRQAAIDHALGATREVFGPEKRIEGQAIPRTVDEQTGEVLEPTEQEESLFEPEDEPQPPDTETEEQKVTRMRQQLAIALDSPLIGPKNREAGKAWLAKSAEGKSSEKLAEKIKATDAVIAKLKARKEGAA